MHYDWTRGALTKESLDSLTHKNEQLNSALIQIMLNSPPERMLAMCDMVHRSVMNNEIPASENDRQLLAALAGVGLKILVEQVLRAASD